MIQRNINDDATLAYLFNKGDKKVDVLRADLINLIYPVGSIYMSVNRVSPQTFLGGTWDQLPAGYFLESASSGAGDTVAAGLPNITGELSADATNDQWALDDQMSAASTSGNAVRTKSITKAIHDGPYKNNAGAWGGFTFDASRSNSIYGNSTTVQPPAIKCYMWKRTA